MILFLDEATSALDKDGEAKVNQAIKALSITRVIIAHRETTIALADHVIVLTHKADQFRSQEVRALGNSPYTGCFNRYLQ